MEPADSDTERLSVNSESDDEEDKAKWERPPSSYGSMKSESEEEMEEAEEEAEEQHEELAAVPPDTSAPEATGLRLVRSESPETLYTTTTMQTKPPGANIVETRPDDRRRFQADEEEDEEEDYDDDDDDRLIMNSPEPPEFVEPDYSTQSDENGQPGNLHPENDLRHIFESMVRVLSSLPEKEFHSFLGMFRQLQPKTTLWQAMDNDVLNFVDKAMEVLGRDESLLLTVRALEWCKNTKAAELSNLCKRVLTRHPLRAYLIRKHTIIHEGVVRHGCQEYLRKNYVEPEISTRGCGGVDPIHELRDPPPSSFQLPSADTFVGVNNLFRLQKSDGSPVRTVVTTGLPGCGMSVSVAKFSLDWAEEKANRDLQFVIKLSFRKWWNIRSSKMLGTNKLSIMRVIGSLYPDCKDLTYLEEEGCKFLIIMDSFDCYCAPLDWENTPVIEDNHAEAHCDDLIVNIIRGNLLRGARLWILGRRAAVTQIPSKFIDAFTEIQGFSDEMKDEFLTKRTQNTELAQQIVAYFKRLPALVRLARQPFVCWMVFTLYKRAYQFRGFGQHRPRLTPFYINLMLVQMNRRLQFYFGRAQLKLEWSEDDKNLLVQIGKMAFTMLESNTFVFSEDDVKQTGLTFTEVTVLSGMCTELPADGQRTFCFLNVAFQEFLAALYVFNTFRLESRLVLDPGSVQLPNLFTLKIQPKSAADFVQAALTRALKSSPGHYDMFLRFLCGLLNPDCHNSHLCGFLYPHSIPKISGLDEAEQLLRQTMKTAPENRLENLKECLREMTQTDI